MPGETSPIKTANVSSDEESCDDPTGSLIVPSAGFDDDEGPHSGTTEDVFDEDSFDGVISEEELADNWDPSLYTLQAQAPKPLAVNCLRKIPEKPSYLGPEFHGPLSKNGAAQLLGLEDGCYLVRESVSKPGEHVLTFNLGRLWNYRLFYEDGMFYVGDKHFDNLEELVEDGLITLFMQNHVNVAEVMKKGRVAVTRKKTQKTQKLRRQPCRRIKGPRPRRPFIDHRSRSTEPASPCHSLSPQSPLSSVSDSDLISTTELLTPNSDAIQSDLDVSPTSQRCSHFNRQRANAIMQNPSSPLGQRRAKSSSYIDQPKRASLDGAMEKGKYSPVIALRDAVRAERLGSLSISENFVKSNTLGVYDPYAKRSMSCESKSLKSDLSASAGSLEKLIRTLHRDKDKDKEQSGRRLSSTTSVSSTQSLYNKAHKFKMHTYKSPTWCEVCHHFLWGLSQQGMICSDCGMNIHKQCLVGAIGSECTPTKKMVKRTFGVDLTTLLMVEGTTVPTLVEECIGEIEKRGLSAEGLYRISGQTAEILDLKEKWDSGETPDLSAYEDINVLTGVLKLFLRDLPIPLISFDAYSDIIRATSEIVDPSDPTVNWTPLSNALKLLPKAHYNVLKYLTEHLRKVDKLSHENRMTVHNLATVFAPTLMRSPGEGYSAITDLAIQKNFVECVLLKCDVLFE